MVVAAVAETEVLHILQQHRLNLQARLGLVENQVHQVHHLLQVAGQAEGREEGNKIITNYELEITNTNFSNS